MRKKRKAIYLAIVILLSTAFYFYFMGNRISKQVAPNKAIEHLPAAESKISSKGKKENSPKAEKQTLISPTSFGREKIEHSLRFAPAANGDPVNLDDQSYSISNEKKGIVITPGVTIQPGKSVDVKIPGGDKIIRVQRDKVYHPGGYNVLLEKKF